MVGSTQPPTLCFRSPALYSNHWSTLACPLDEARYRQLDTGSVRDTGPDVMENVSPCLCCISWLVYAAVTRTGKQVFLGPDPTEPPLFEPLFFFSSFRCLSSNRSSGCRSRNSKRSNSNFANFEFLHGKFLGYFHGLIKTSSVGTTSLGRFWLATTLTIYQSRDRTTPLVSFQPCTYGLF